MPSLCNKVAALGGVDALCQKLASVESFELVENVVRALEKVALENPYAILAANGILYMSQLIDFFDFGKQKTILSLLTTMAKSIGAPQDIESYIIPAVPSLKNLLRYRDSDEKSKEITELSTAFYVAICDSVSRFYEFNPANIPKFRKDYEMISSDDLIDSLFELLLVGSSSPGYLALTTKTWQNVMATLRYMCKFSPKICKYSVGHGVLGIIQTMLSGESGSDSKSTENVQAATQEAIESVILLLDAILPQKHLINTSGKEGENEAERFSLESEKEKILFDQGGAVEVLGETVLAQVIHIYEESAALGTKFFCLQTIDKLCYLCDSSAIVKVLNPQAAALFIYDNLSSVESMFVCFGLRLCEIVLQKLAKVQKQYIVSLKREGVFELAKQLHDFTYLDKQYGHQADKNWFVAENPYAKHFLSFAAKADKSSLSPSKKFEATLQSKYSYGLNPPLYGQRSLANQLKYYIYYKSEQLLAEYFESPSVQKMEEIGLAAGILSGCQKLAAQLDELLRLGIAGLPEQWKEVYQRLAEALVGETGITNYELKCTGLITKVFYSLCMMPTDYVRTMLAPASEETKADSEETKANSYRGPQRAELAQMVIRHEAFISTLSKVSLGKKHALSELIRRLNEILMRIEKYVEDNKFSSQANSLNMLRSYGQTVSLLLMYSPKGTKIPLGYTKLKRIPGDIPEDFKKSSELTKMHNMYVAMPTYPVTLHPSTTLKSVEEFLKKKAPQFSDFEFREPSMRHSYSSNVPLPEDFYDEDTQDFPPEDQLFLSPDAEEPLPPTFFPIPPQKPPKPLPTMAKAHSQSDDHSKVSLRFYYNGYEIVNKNETLGDLIKKYPSKIPDLPRDAQGVLLFQLHEKLSSGSKKAAATSESYADRIDKVMRGQSSFIEGLVASEQDLLNVCLSEVAFKMPQIKDEDLLAAIKLLKVTYRNIKTVWGNSKTIAPDISHIKEADFLNGKIEKLAKKQLQDPLQMFSFVVSPWMKFICTECPFMLTERTRALLFKMCFLDKSRSLHYLVQYLKGSSPISLPLPSLSKLQRMKLKVHRKAILDCGIKVMNAHGGSRASLEFDFFEENGSGLGPTLEFYSLSAAALRELDFLWRPMDKGTLFPAPINPDNSEAGIKGIPTSKICQLFKFAGWLCARAIVDDRLVDLPFADIFWELVLGKHATLVDLKRVDQRNGVFFLELDRLRTRKAAILRTEGLTTEQKRRQIEALTIGDGYKVEDIELAFVLQGYDHIELKQGGKDILLTIDNIEEYLDLTTIHTLYKTIYPQIQAFKEGFETVLSIDSLRCFKTEELEDLVCGGKEEKWDPMALAEQITPSQGYDKTSPQYMFFIEYLSNLSTPTQRLFLQYVTGSPRLPFGGFAKLNPRLTVAKRITPEDKNPDDFLPSVMTCQNFLKVPEYSSYAALQNKFDYALKEGQNSFTLSQADLSLVA
eukprot:TRINITY_DN1618_c0_g1_i1.p1 TRINITY_DN1618_c0_g1~~TRINITY_DN1618_c0_g1_i1.p1  ORF type:complete len:1441 (+),score=186.83 TRINITY_DN1618_c0_g1_i1:639-4961(+)